MQGESDGFLLGSLLRVLILSWSFVPYKIHMIYSKKSRAPS